MTFLPRGFLRREAGNGSDASDVFEVTAALKVPDPIKVGGQTCQWIDGPVTGGEECKCGKPVVGRLPGRAPYCPDHAARCFESAAAWRRRNAWLKDLDGGFAQMTLRDWLGDGHGDGAGGRE